MKTESIAQGVRRARSNFYLAMRLMPRRRRAAMFAVYAFARALDDIVDGADSLDDKRKALDAWRIELGRIYAGTPTTPIGHALGPVVAAFRLSRDEFEELIRGMEMDLSDEMRAPSLQWLELYCRRVAGSIGLLALPIFGCDGPAERAFARRLGHAMQLTNIVRDVDEDGARGRIYLPREVLDDAGVVDGDPARVLTDPRFPAAWQAACALAHSAFAAAEDGLAACPHPRRLWPALVMMGVYRRVLRHLTASGPRTGRVRIVPAAQLRIALRAILLARA